MVRLAWHSIKHTFKPNKAPIHHEVSNKDLALTWSSSASFYHAVYHESLNNPTKPNEK